MTASSEYTTVLNMDRDLITTVSQEFVLQFYTIMNKHPGSLHRFYKEESSLIRDDLYAQGQQEIHKFYMNLELSNCKAVVLSLDAVRAHHKSILIQVTGEIANNGSDLRRFMQSFVLVEQDLGNFYVLNDVFRYQDQTFRAEDVDEAVTGEQEGRDEEIRGEANSWGDVGTRPCEPLAAEQQMQGSPMVSESEEPASDEYAGYSKGADEQEEASSVATTVVAVEQERAPTEVAVAQKADEQAGKSWAAIINPMSQRPSKPTAPVAPQPQVSKPTPPPPQSKALANNGDGYEKRKPRFNNNGGGGGGGGSGSGNNGNGGGGSAKPQGAMNYPDENQLFVGNLPQSMTEDDLRDFFSSAFGTVKDVRIQKSRCSGDGKPLPNFGFLVFHSHDVVDEILKNKPIYYSSHRLNVEQKLGNTRPAHKPLRR